MTPLGVVSNKYKVINNRECFGFLDAVVRAGELRYHTAGAMEKGERVWLLAQLPGALRIAGSDDVTEQYLLLSNSHDAGSALRVVFTPIRVVCANTLSAALAAAGGQGVTVRHTGDPGRKVAEARRVLGRAARWFEQFGEGAALMAGHRPSEPQLRGYFRALYPDPEALDPAGAKATRMTLLGLYEQGMGQDLPGVRGTTWAAFNAVTEYIDHHVGKGAQGRLESAWWGDGSRAKARAFDLALELARCGAGPRPGPG
jgi:phage/plasmid-like protein (TIGR03299 family)